MGMKWNTSWKAGMLAGLILCGCGVVAAKGSGSGQGSQSQHPAQPADKPKTPDTAPLTLDPAPPVTAVEDAAFKEIQAVSSVDPA